MKFIRYVLFFQLLLVLGLLAVAYAAPETLLLTVSAAGTAESDCGPVCQTASLEAERRVDLPVESPPQDETMPGRSVNDAGMTPDGSAAEPRQEDSPPQEAVGALETIQADVLRLRELLPEKPAPSSANQDSSLDAGNPVADVMRLDPGLVDEIASQGIDLREMLQVDAELSEFVRSVSTGHSGVVRGIFVADTLSMPVRRQPAGNPGFISSEDGVATQFGLAENYGTIGLLAHNYLAGSEFFTLEKGQQVYVVYGDGDVRRFVITEIHNYRAGQPNSPYSDFYDLDKGGEKYTAKEIFHKMYNRDGDLVLQTCIAGEGISTWGRLFVIATPVSGLL